MDTLCPEALTAADTIVVTGPLLFTLKLVVAPVVPAPEMSDGVILNRIVELNPETTLVFQRNVFAMPPGEVVNPVVPESEPADVALIQLVPPFVEYCATIDAVLLSAS